jgi:site-specific DNA-methyltransferase (adenine-specific)
MSDVRLHLGDCLDVLRTLESGGVDAVVTDPPYGQSNESYDRGVNPEVWRECYRVAKPNAALLSFAGSPTYHRIASDIEAAGWRVRQMWAWVYGDGLITSAYPREGFDRLAPAFTPICFAVKGKILLPLAREGGPWKVRFRKQAHHSPMSRRSGENACPAEANGHWPRSLVSDGTEGFEFFSLSHGRSNRDGNTGHPNQKDVRLTRWLLDKLPRGGTVLDPFMGSGTAGVACVRAGRDFVGVEINEVYFKVAERRIAEAQNDAPLFDGTASAPDACPLFDGVT